MQATVETTTTKVPKFLRCLYDMLQYEDRAILHWCHDGTYFQVREVARLEREVLPKYFKHSKFTSFQRQLNNFGFHKWTKTRANVCTFSHDVLVQCHPNQLSEMLTAVAYASWKASAAHARSSAASSTASPSSSPVGLKRQRSDRASSGRMYCSGAGAMAPPAAPSVSAVTFSTAAADAKTQFKRLCVDMDLNVDIVNADADMEYALHRADIDHIFDSLVSGGDASPLLLLDAVDVSDLLALDWSQAAASSTCHIDTVGCDDELLALLPDPLSFECARNDTDLSSRSACADVGFDVDVSTALAFLSSDVLVADLVDNSELLTGLEDDATLLRDEHELSPEHVVSL